MPIANLSEADEIDAAVECIDSWISRELGDSQSLLVAAERQQVSDRTATFRWYLRLKGEEKDFITIWFSLGQRTLHHEAQFMPAPEANISEVFTYLLRRNAYLYGMSFSLGPENAIYLTGRVPSSQIDDDELDRIVGSSVIYIDDHFPTAMSLGHPGLYRRRPRR